MERSFESWFRAPVRTTCRDPRFEIRRAAPDDFPKIYDLVDRDFGMRRDRAAYEWLYTRNPGGMARCWLMIERARGRPVASIARYPWPVAFGSERLPGEFGGDMAISPEWQHKGLYPVFMEVRDSHAWHGDTVILGAPNLGSRKALAKLGLGDTVMGPFPSVVLPLDLAGMLAHRSSPHVAASFASGAVNATLAAWRRLVLAHDEHIRTESVTYFGADIGPLGLESQAQARYWCPHSAEFLNWRYFENPSESYLAQAATVGDRVVGYSVLRIDGRTGMIMDFVAAPAPAGGPRALLRAIIDAAREAGCNKITFYATSGWKHWPLFRRAGFISRRSSAYRSARYGDRPDVCEERNWQLLPGDSDVH